MFSLKLHIYNLLSQRYCKRRAMCGKERERKREIIKKVSTWKIACWLYRKRFFIQICLCSPNGTAHIYSNFPVTIYICEFSTFWSKKKLAAIQFLSILGCFPWIFVHFVQLYPSVFSIIFLLLPTSLSISLFILLHSISM